jgi:hypothetical protein
MKLGKNVRGILTENFGYAERDIIKENGEVVKEFQFWKIGKAKDFRK